MRIALLLCTAFILRVATEPIPAKLGMQLNLTQVSAKFRIGIQLPHRNNMTRKAMSGSFLTPGRLRPSGCGCLPDWYQYGSRCFKPFLKRKTWIDAEKYCMYFGAHLASIHNPGEHDLIYSMASETNYYRAWIGASNAVDNSTWLWSDGSMFHYTNWGSGEPNNADGQEKCNEITTTGWNDQNCEDSIPFICGTRPDGQL